MQPVAGDRVIVALSGGVDSAVAALRLVAAGYRVEALHMTNWDDADPACTAREDLADARSVADDLGITLHHVNFADQYRAQVFSGFVAGYGRGETPNPDVDCNRHIKFGVCLAHARRLGAQWLATGHYARLDHGPPTRLRMAVDAAKDQTYFLHAVDRDALAAALFPLGELTKAEVRRAATAAGLRVHAKRDSTGICFIGRRPLRDFLGGYVAGEPGPVVDADGHVLGQHRGLCFYTIGQRQGFGIGGQRGQGRPWYVAGKDPVGNRLLVVPGRDHPWLWRRDFAVRDPHWLEAPPEDGSVLRVRVRHRQALTGCTVTGSGTGRFRVVAAEALFAVTSGQYAVFYRDDVCIGGGPIEALGGVGAGALPL